MRWNPLDIFIMSFEKAYPKYCEKHFDDSLPDVSWRVKLRFHLHILGGWFHWWKWYYFFKSLKHRHKEWYKIINHKGKYKKDKK